MREGDRPDSFGSERMRIGRNQYLIASCGIENKFEYDQMLELGLYHVLLGERTQYQCLRSIEVEWLLIGYAIDVQHPQDNEEKMLIRLDESCDKDLTNLADMTFYWGGRWVLFSLRGNSLSAITDSCGLKQLFHGYNVFGSQSRYVAKVVNAEVDAKAEGYIKQAMAVDKEYAWPLDVTPYNGIKRLLPNHIYNKGQIYRIHPHEFFSGKSQEERVIAVADLLKTMMQAAATRTNLAVTLTAGWDSRLVLAACDKVKEKIDVVTLKYQHIADSHMDIQIPKQLCEKYGFVHKVLSCRHLAPGFVAAYKAHAENAHDYWIQMIQSVRDYGYEDWLWTKGSCNEVCRNSSGILYDWQVNTRVLSKLYGVMPCDYSKTIISRWLKSAKAYAAETGYSVLDLFYWEHRLGSWLAECLNEADVVGETFTPFSVRAYFELIKGVSISERISPDYRFFEEVLRASAMSLDIPVNPHRYDSFSAKVKCLLKNKLHLIYGMILSR